MTENKTWFITGTSRGFGREWAIAALERGDRVAATARSTAARSTGRSANSRTVRRSATADCWASSVPRRNQSCAAGRTSAVASRPSR